MDKKPDDIFEEKKTTLIEESYIDKTEKLNIKEKNEVEIYNNILKRNY